MSVLKKASMAPAKNTTSILKKTSAERTHEEEQSELEERLEKDGRATNTTSMKAMK